MKENIHSMSKSAEVLRSLCPVCGEAAPNLHNHLFLQHGDEELKEAVLQAKHSGMSDSEIGKKFGISYGTLERILIEAQGINLNRTKRTKLIKRWEPSAFQPERTTVWSFPQRGDWATHSGSYRGNWSPYIPRNVILKYSRPGDIVLDYFVGGGTTAVEAKLLGRRCIGIDINPAAVELTRQNLAFSPPLFTECECYEPEVRTGDARNLDWIEDESIDLICSHPPYAGIIKYSTGIDGDLSGLEMEDFLREMHRVAKESYRVLKPGGKCAILIGDGRKARHVVPIGFETIRVFLDAGFRLKELVIKRQHNCKTTGFWYNRSIQHNFLLLAHEYLPIFEKVHDKNTSIPLEPQYAILELNSIDVSTDDRLETTSVWLFPEAQIQERTVRNLASRYANENVLIVETQDCRQEGQVVPNGLLTYEKFKANPNLILREVIIVAPEALPPQPSLGEDLQVVHRYIFVYTQKTR